MIKKQQGCEGGGELDVFRFLGVIGQPQSVKIRCIRLNPCSIVVVVVVVVVVGARPKTPTKLPTRTNPPPQLIYKT